jgi:hypothetical protein
MLQRAWILAGATAGSPKSPPPPTTPVIQALRLDLVEEM